MKKLLTLFLFLFLYLFSYAQIDLQKGLIAHYPFNGNANDESGNGKNGTLQNRSNCSFTTGKYGQAIYLQGGEYYAETVYPQGGYVSLPYFDFSAMQSFSISLWVKEDGMSCTHGEAYINFGEENNGGSIKIAHYINSGLSFFVGDSSINQNYSYSSDFILLTLTYENGIAKAYRNFTLIGTQKVTLPTLTKATQAIGKHWWYDKISTHYSSARLIGAIDDIRIYNRALNTEEITQLYTPAPTLSIETTRSISTYSVSRTQGYTYPIQYTLTGDIKADNKVAAYLSDKDGSFTNEINVGTVVSSSSGIMSINIPAGTVDGSNYKLRLKSSNPQMISSESPSFYVQLNDAPTDITLSNNHFSENLALGTAIGTVQALDPDLDDKTFTYAISDNSNFRIEGNIIKTNRYFNYETEIGVYNFTVKATDPWGKSYTKSLTLYLDNVNEMPEFTIPTQNFKIQAYSEIALSGFLISDVDVYNEDLTLKLTCDDGVFRFTDIKTSEIYAGALNSNSITVKAGLNRLNQIFNSLVFKSSTNLDGVTKIIIEVSDLGHTGSGGIQILQRGLYINVFTPKITLTGSIPSCSISRSKGTSFTLNYGLTGTYQADNQFVAYLSDKNGSFSNETRLNGLVSNTAGIFTVNLPAGIADGSGYKIRLKSSNPTAISNESSSFTIDLNDAPTDITLSNNHINEGMLLGSKVGTLNASDLDLEDTHSYSTIFPNSYFYVEGNSIKTAYVFDYETEPQLYTFAVKASDNHQAFCIQTFNIYIDNVNESPSLSMPLLNTPIQAQTDLAIHGVNVYDKDSYSLVITVSSAKGTLRFDKLLNTEITEGSQNSKKITFSGTLSRLNEILNSLVFNSDANFEGQTKIDFRIVDYDIILQAPLSINVFQPQITLTGSIPSCSISRSKGTNFTLNYDLTGTYQSDNQFIAYLSDKNGSFSNETLLNGLVSNTAGIFTVNLPAGIADGSGYKIRLKSSNPNVVSNESSSFTIELNDAPLGASLSNSLVSENQAIGTTIGTILGSDLDTGDTFTYTPANDASNFYIEDNILKTSRLFDYESLPNVYTFAVKVSDNHQAFCIQTFNIYIDNVNEAPSLQMPSQKITAIERRKSPVNGFIINDVDVYSGNLQVQISTENGVLQFEQINPNEIVSGSQNSTSIVFESNLSRVNEILNSMNYIGNTYFYGEVPISISVSDKGNTGSGNAQTVAKTLKINVKPLPPSISLQPISSIKGCVNESATFSICADGAKPIVYQWYKDGNVLYSEKNNFINIPIKSDEEAGSYYCVASNLGGDTPSSQGVLWVKSQNFKADIANIKLCTGDTEGEIAITATGGWGDYLYSIDNGQTYFQSPIFKKLHVGTYSIVIKDNNNCTTSKDFTVKAPPLMKPNVKPKNSTCKDDNNGELDLNVVGGTPPFVLDIQSSKLNLSLTFDSNSKHQILKNLIPDLYTVTINDQNSCDTLAVIRLTEPDKLNFTSQIHSVTCYGERNGEIAFSLKGGTEPYSLYWTNKEMTNLVKDFKSGTYKLSEVAKYQGLIAGRYDFYITDSQSCYTSENIEIQSPSELKATFANNTLIATGGTSPYEYSANGRSFSTDNKLILSSGLHNLVVRDSKFCLATVSQYIDNKELSENKPVADFLFHSQGLSLNLVGTLLNTQTCTWDFGDGTFSNDQISFTHHYAQVGTYQVVMTAYNDAGVMKVEKTVQIVNEERTAVSKDTETEFSIYPNPATEQIYIQTTPDKYLEISIFDASGRKIISTKNLQIAVNGFAKGFYMVQVQNSKGKSTKKLIVK